MYRSTLWSGDDVCQLGIVEWVGASTVVHFAYQLSWGFVEDRSGKESSGSDSQHVIGVVIGSTLGTAAGVMILLISLVSLWRHGYFDCGVAKVKSKDSGKRCTILMSCFPGVRLFRDAALLCVSIQFNTNKKWRMTRRMMMSMLQWLFRMPSIQRLSNQIVQILSCTSL